MRLKDLTEEKRETADSWFANHFMWRTIYGGSFSSDLMTETPEGFSYGDNLFTRLDVMDSKIKYPLNKISGIFWLVGTNCKTLKNGPKIVERNLIVSCGLTSLDHAPKEVHGNVDFSDNKLKSLEHFPKLMSSSIPSVDLAGNKFASLKDINKYIPRCEILNVIGNPIKSNILSTLLIEGLTLIHYSGSNKASDAFKIIAKHLKDGNVGKRGVISARQELIDADLDDFAEL